MKKKIKIPQIKSYLKLTEKLKENDISPQEAWDLIYKVKVKTNKKTIWKLEKFKKYASERLDALYDVFSKDKKDQIKSLNGKDYLLALKKILPKRVDTIRKVVDSKQFLLDFNYFHKHKKIDKRKEVKNLEKLIVDKRQDQWWDIVWMSTLGEASKKNKLILIDLKYNKTGYKELLNTLR